MLFILQAQQSPIIGFLPLILVLIVIYFFFMRPQAKKQKLQDEFVQGLQKGDKVVTSSGIVGQITKVDENSIQLQLDQKNYMTVVTGAISKEMTDQYFKED